MASYWDRQAYEAKKNAAASQTSALTPEAPISFAGMTQLGSGVPNVGFNQAAYASQQQSAGLTPAAKKTTTPKPPKTPKVKLYSDVFPKGKIYAEDGTKTRVARDPNTLNKQGLKKYTASRLGIKSTYTAPKNTETTIANSNTSRLQGVRSSTISGKSSLIIKKVNS